MKKLIYVFAILLCFLFAGKLLAVNDSCLKMVYPNDKPNGFYNPDSVKIDTCITSPTYGKWYARKSYKIHTETYIFRIKPLLVDSIYSWVDIDTNLVEIRNAFHNLVTKYGNYTLKRYSRDINDSDHIRVPLFEIEFENYQLVDSVKKNIRNIDTVDYCVLSRLPNLDYVFEISKNSLNIIINQKDNTIIIDFQNTKFQELTNIKIYDIFGNCLYENRIFEELQKISIDISLLNNGIYFIGINEKTYKFSVVR